MKKLCLILTLIFTLTSAIPVFASATEAKNGGYIVLQDANDEKLVAAGKTLSDYMKKITDKDFPVANEGEGLRFTLGFSSDAPVNGYIIKTEDNAVSIIGNGTSGVIRGVYAFLEKYCGCDWYTSTLYSIPKNTNLTIPSGEETVYKPYFEYTDTDWLSPRDVEYSLANGLNGNTYRIISDELGGNVEYISNFCHTLGSQFCSRDTYFESNPEYFALHNGIRQSEQLCLTNEDVYNLVLSEVMDVLKEKHDPEKSLQIVSITQGDSAADAKMCQCKNCKAIDDENGSHSGTMITFANRIAKAVKEAGYENVAIDTFAYRYTRKAPTKVVPDDNVIVRLCTIECCFAHPIDDTTCPSNYDFMTDLTAWGKICNRIYIWDYATNYAHTLGIFPDFGVLQKNIKTFLKNNVVGIYEEGNYYMDACDGEFGELRAYLLSKLMQNPYIDFNDYMNDFLKAYYGNGWENIREFIDLTIQNPTPKGVHLSIYNTMADTLGFSANDIEKADKLWEDAKKAAGTDVQLKNIERSEISWRYWKAFNNFDKEENAKLVEDMKALGITKVSEGDTAGPEGIAFINANATKLGNNALFPISIMFYVVTAVLGAATMIAALVKKPRKYIYILLCVLIGVFFEIFGWHRRALLGGVATGEVILTFVLIAILFAIGGALIPGKGKKQRLISAIICPVVWMSLYGISFLAMNLIFGGGAKEACIGAAYVFTGIQSVIMIVVTLRNILNQNKN